jgi:hypothetical protein
MSEIPGPLSAIGVPIADSISQFKAAPPQQRQLILVGLAASGFSWCVYLAPYFAGPLWQAGIAAPAEEWLVAEIWAGATAFALLALIVALAGARGMRDGSAALWRLMLAGLCAALLWWQIYPEPEGNDWVGVAGFFLKGAYWGWLAAHLARFCAASQLLFGDPEDRARRKLERERRREERRLRKQFDEWVKSVEAQASDVAAHDATEDEARAVLSGHGGRRNQLDERRFP